MVNNCKFIKCLKNKYQICCYYLFSRLFSDKNEVFGWGNSEYNQLDLSEGVQQINTPIHMKMIQKYGKIIDIASGGSACMVLNGIHFATSTILS